MIIFTKGTNNSDHDCTCKTRWMHMATEDLLRSSEAKQLVCARNWTLLPVNMMLWFYSEVFLCTRADDHVLQHELVLQQEQGSHKVCLRFISDLEIVHKRQYFFFILSLRFSLPSVLKSLFPGLNGTAWAFWTPIYAGVCFNTNDSCANVNNNYKCVNFPLKSPFLVPLDCPVLFYDYGLLQSTLTHLNRE